MEEKDASEAQMNAKAKTKKPKSHKTRDLIEVAVIFVIIVVTIIIIRYLFTKNFFLDPDAKLKYLLEQEESALEAAKDLRNYLQEKEKNFPSFKKITLAELEIIIQNHRDTLHRYSDSKFQERQ